ncbi:putative gustatory receptor 28a [Linepithema humile]|uniref:putative gustatory receptor 28a n=1 Tax=Linepithema humile TaxID=83485 RepID=UPI00351EEA33
MTKTIQSALAPLLIICSFCGLSYLEYLIERSRPYFTCLYFLIKWSLYSYLFYHLIYTNPTAFIYFNLLCKLEIFIILVSTLVNLLRHKELKTCLHRLSIVNNTLEVFGKPKDYQWLHKLTVRVIIIWIALVCFLDTLDIFLLNYGYFSITHIFIPFVGNYIDHINVLGCAMWGIILRYIGSRFQLINEHLESLVKNDIKYTKRENLILNEEYQKSQRRTKANKIKKRRKSMWIIMHVHLQLCLISRDLNKIFSVQMTLQITTMFIFVVLECCMIYTALLRSGTTLIHTLDNLIVCFWFIQRNIIFLILNYVCQIVCEKANKAIVILYQLSNSSPDKVLREQVLQFILQIKQRKVQFSGMGLFYLGNNFIRQFYTAVATVVVIILQMNLMYDELLCI